MAPENKPVGWRIPDSLRHRLTSHAEYLISQGNETNTEIMVAAWLEERLKPEEIKRAYDTLKEHGSVLNSAHENGQGSVRRSSPKDAGKARTKDKRNKGSEKTP